MADNIVRLVLPSAGMNVDTSASRIDENESPELYNVIVSEPNQIRPRKGWKRRSPMGMPDVLNRPVTGIVRFGNDFYISARYTDTYIASFSINGPKNAVTAPYAVGMGTLLASFPSSTVGQTSYLVRASSNNKWTYTVANSRVSTRVPTVSFESATFYIQETVSGYVTRLKCWSGRDEINISTAAKLDTTITTPPSSTYLLQGTFASVPQLYGQNVSLVGCFIRWPGLPKKTDDKPYNPRREYLYRIASHEAGSTTFTIEKPYGMGANDWDYTSNNDTPVDFIGCIVESNPLIPYAPTGSEVVGVYMDRLFLGRGNLPFNSNTTPRGNYQNAIFWSEPGSPSAWPTDNFLVIDDRYDDAITAFGYAGGRLLVFRRRRFYVLEGDGLEAGYSAKLISDSVGCVDPYSVCQWQDWCIFVSQDGVFAYDGAQLMDLSQSAPGHGIRSELLPLLRRDNNLGDAYMHLRVACTVVNDYLLVSVQDTRSTSTPNDMYMLHLPTRAWTKWGNKSWPVAFHLFERTQGNISRETLGFGLTTEDPTVVLGKPAKPKTIVVASLDNMVSGEEPMTQADRFDEMPTFTALIPNGAPSLPIVDVLEEYLP